MNLRLGTTGTKVVMEFKIRRRAGSNIQKDSSGPAVKHKEMLKVAILEITSLTHTRELRNGRRKMENFSINQVLIMSVEMVTILKGHNPDLN